MNREWHLCYKIIFEINKIDNFRMNEKSRVSKEINFEHGFRAGISMINARFFFNEKSHTRFYLVLFCFVFKSGSLGISFNFCV